MNEQGIKWLESPEGEAQSRKDHRPIYRPLISVVRDGDASNLMGDFCILWLA